MTESAAILQTLALERFFGSIHALRGVSFEVNSKELFGLIGPDGAGKTTAIRILAGLMAPSAGAVLVDGRDPLRARRSLSGMVGYMPQQYSLYGDLSVDENLYFFGQLFSLSADDYAARRERLLRITRLNRFTDRRADALSGGMYKKLALACALLHRPQILLLDEPTNGVDPVSRRELWDLLYEFVSEGMAIVLSTPYMDEAARCQRVGLIHHGRLVLQGQPGALLEQFGREYVTFLVEGASRTSVEHELSGDARVIALTPAGARIRVVSVKGDEAGLRERLLPAGGRLVAVRPEFEDLFLAHTRTTPAGVSNG
jgi:ABC-2 type transport system ATP-binding protein